MSDRFNIRGHVVVTRSQFSAMKVVAFATSSTGPAYRNQRCRTLIGGRWHILHRSIEFGTPTVSAHPITIRLTATELQECAA